MQKEQYSFNLANENDREVIKRVLKAASTAKESDIEEDEDQEDILTSTQQLPSTVIRKTKPTFFPELRETIRALKTGPGAAIKLTFESTPF